jgi:hypothetical protein
MEILKDTRELVGREAKRRVSTTTAEILQMTQTKLEEQVRKAGRHRETNNRAFEPGFKFLTYN